MSHRILIADDEPNIVVSLEFMMKREGYDVLVARDGTEALATIRGSRPALVCGAKSRPASSRSAITLRMVAALTFSLMSRVSVREPTGSPVSR